jgi:hypothetical protein
MVGVMRSDRELFEWLESERRKYALLFSVKPRVVRKMPKLWAIGLPLVLVGFIAILIVQQTHISDLKTDNFELQRNLTTLHESNEWYKETLNQQITAAKTAAKVAPQPTRATAPAPQPDALQEPAGRGAEVPGDVPGAQDGAQAAAQPDASGELPYPQGPIDDSQYAQLPYPQGPIEQPSSTYADPAPEPASQPMQELSSSEVPQPDAVPQPEPAPTPTRAPAPTPMVTR